MVKITILSFYSGLIDRGVETWASSLKNRLGGDYTIDIVSGNKIKNIKWQSKNQFYWTWLIFTDAVKNTSKWTDADIVIPTNGKLQSLYCRLVSWLKRKPLVIFGHSGPGADDKWNLLCSPNVFVAFSDYQKNWAEKYKLPWTKIIKISHAVDLSRFSPVAKKPNKNIILCVAANDPDKRINLVSESVKMIPGAQFMAVGSGNPIISSYEEMPEVYKKADVFCLVPETWEAFGLVFLEAMGSNLPIVTIDDPVRREIVGEAGIFVKEPITPAKLSEAIKTALNLDWGNKPRQQAEKFSWDKIIEKYENLFLDLTK